MKYYFHEDATSEFIRAVDSYEDCEIGLGLKFSEEVYTTIQRVCDFPFAWKK
jgi:hypothetical protein